MVKFTYKTLVQRCGMEQHLVRHRVEVLKLGQEITKTLFLYSDDDVKKIKAYPNTE